MRPLFKFNPSSTGAAMFTSWGYHKNGSGIVAFLRVVKQGSWNPQNKTGSCKNQPEAKAMMNLVEMVGILEAINSKGNFKTYHKGSTGQCAITFDHIEGKGYTFKIFRENTNFLVGLSYAEARLFALSIEANVKADCTAWMFKQPGEFTPAQDEAGGYEENA